MEFALTAVYEPIAEGRLRGYVVELPEVAAEDETVEAASAAWNLAPSMQSLEENNGKQHSGA